MQHNDLCGLPVASRQCFRSPSAPGKELGREDTEENALRRLPDTFNYTPLK